LGFEVKGLVESTVWQLNVGLPKADAFCEWKAVPPNPCEEDLT
jgi:hypothetical protein